MFPVESIIPRIRAFAFSFPDSRFTNRPRLCYTARMKKMLLAAVVAACAVQGVNALPTNAVRDALDVPELRRTRIQGPIGAKFDIFMHERCLSDFARNVVVREAREAFAHPDDDIFNAPVGMWKG